MRKRTFEVKIKFFEIFCQFSFFIFLGFFFGKSFENQEEIFFFQQKKIETNPDDSKPCVKFQETKNFNDFLSLGILIVQGRKDL